MHTTLTIILLFSLLVFYPFGVAKDAMYIQDADTGQMVYIPARASLLISDCSRMACQVTWIGTNRNGLMPIHNINFVTPSY